MRRRGFVVLVVSGLMAGCVAEKQPPTPAEARAIAIDPVWSPGEPFQVSGCQGFEAELVADPGRVAAQLPPAFTMLPNRRVILHAATCSSGAALDQPGADLVVAYVPVEPHEGAGPEFFLLELSTSNATAREALQGRGIPGDTVTLVSPRAPGGSWEVRGPNTLYTFTILPNPAPRIAFDDVTYRIWGGPEGATSGHISLRDRLAMDSDFTGCSLLADSGAIAAIAPLPPCTAQLSESSTYLLEYDA